jgi:hypothetical protein
VDHRRPVALAAGERRRAGNPAGDRRGRDQVGEGTRRMVEMHRRGKGAAKEARMYAIKAEIVDPKASVFEFVHQKTMYGGKHIAEGDTIYLFASENEGGAGLIGSGVVTSVRETPRRSGVARQTPRVSITVRRTALAKRSLGRRELRPHSDWNDGRPETELNFKFYRQATNKIVGISGKTAAFLRTCVSRSGV